MSTMTNESENVVRAELPVPTVFAGDGPAELWHYYREQAPLYIHRPQTPPPTLEQVKECRWRLSRAQRAGERLLGQRGMRPSCYPRGFQALKEFMQEIVATPEWNSMGKSEFWSLVYRKVSKVTATFGQRRTRGGGRFDAEVDALDGLALPAGQEFAAAASWHFREHGEVAPWGGRGSIPGDIRGIRKATTLARRPKGALPPETTLMEALTAHMAHMIEPDPHGRLEAADLLAQLDPLIAAAERDPRYLEALRAYFADPDRKITRRATITRLAEEHEIRRETLTRKIKAIRHRLAELGAA